MTIVADVVIPVGPYHTEIAADAVASAHAQTVPVNVIRVDDTDGRGKAWARNTGVARSNAPFLVFLDADDLLHPQFVEQTLATYQQRSYVYTDWQTHENTVRYATQKTNFFRVGMFHIITTLLPRAAFEAVGGFDLTLPALEDEDLYYKLQAAGICGIRCPEPLVTYRKQYGRGLVNSVHHGAAARDKAVEQMQRIFSERYGIYRGLTNMCSCNDPKPKSVNLNQPQEGDILVKAVYVPQKQVGPVTGRGYPRAGLGDEIWVNAQDVEARPDWWLPVPKIETPSVDDIRRMAMG